MSNFSIAIHGGAGTVAKANLTPHAARAFHAGLRRALEAGAEVLGEGGAALDAVTAAVSTLEDDPLFNAGRGAVFNEVGQQEMDAAVMDGRTRAAGAVIGVFGPRNPVQVARAVLERGPHVALMARGAEEFARTEGLTFEDADYFHTEARWKALQDTVRMRAEGREDDDPARRHGTVGAVARDRAGNLAAATSTGGMTAKAAGRIGDTPMIGAGTFADNGSCAVSATGNGEVFIRFCAANEISARMRHAGQTITEAARFVVMEELARNDGSGGLVAVDAGGNVTMPFNCEGMYRGVIEMGGAAQTFIHSES